MSSYVGVCTYIAALTVCSGPANVQHHLTSKTGIKNMYFNKLFKLKYELKLSKSIIIFIYFLLYFIYIPLLMILNRSKHAHK